MSYFIQPVITTKAQSEIAYAIANKQPVTFTRMVLGSGRHTSAIESKTDVVSAVHTLQVAQTIGESDTFKVVGRLDNQNISQELSINEIGIFARVGSRSEFMYMYTSAQNGDVIPPFRESALVRDYEFNTRIARNGQLNVTYSGSDKVYAKQSDFASVYETIRNLNLTYLTQAVFNIFKQGYDSFKSAVEQHIANRNNPHGVTKSQVGLGSVDNIQQASKQEFNAHSSDGTRHVTSQERTKWNSKAEGSHTHSTTDIVGLQAYISSANSHMGNRNNPHGVNKAQVGLGNVDNVQQAPKSEFDAHIQDITRHITSAERIEWNEKLTSYAKKYVSDMNTALTAGVYYFDHLTSNKPSNAAYGWLFVGVTHQKQKNNNNWLIQKVITTDGQQYSRRKINADNWTSWENDLIYGGSNSNGKWLRMPDGTQLCYGNILMDYGAGVYTNKKTINYPIPFSDYPSASITINLFPNSDTNHRLPGVNITDTSPQKISFTVGDNAGGRNGSQMYVMYTAMGRWK